MTWCGVGQPMSNILQILPYVASTVRSTVPQMVSEVATNTAKLDPDRFGMQHASTSPTVDTVPGQISSRIVRSRPLQSVSGFATFPELALPVRKSGPEIDFGLSTNEVSFGRYPVSQRCKRPAKSSGDEPQLGMGQNRTATYVSVLSRTGQAPCKQGCHKKHFNHPGSYGPRVHQSVPLGSSQRCETSWVTHVYYRMISEKQ